MFKVEIKNLSVNTFIGVSMKERKKKQLLKVSLNFKYSVSKNKELDNIKKLERLFEYYKIFKKLY